MNADHPDVEVSRQPDLARQLVDASRQRNEGAMWALVVGRDEGELTFLCMKLAATVATVFRVWEERPEAYPEHVLDDLLPLASQADDTGQALP